MNNLDSTRRKPEADPQSTGLASRAWTVSERSTWRGLAVGAWPRGALGYGAAVLLAAVVSSAAVGCSSQKTPAGPFGADPAKQSLAEYDLARDFFLNQHKGREALAHALKAVKFDEDNADAAHLVSLIYLSFCVDSSPDCHLDEAERYARSAVKLRKNFREAKNTLAVVLIHRGHYKQAIALLEPLATDILYSTPEIAWGNLGWAYLKQGDARHAVEALQRAIALQPDFCVGSYRLGLAYEKVGEYKAAREALTRALQTDRPQCKGIQDAYLARARTALKEGDKKSARADLERCRELARNNPTGHECSSALANLE